MTIRQIETPPNGHDPDELPPRPVPLAPHSVEAEEAVIGSILLNPHIIHDLKGWLLPHHFYIAKNQWVYEAMLSLAHRREHISVLTLALELSVRNQIEQIAGDIRGDAYLMRLANDTPTYIHAGTYARHVKELSRRRDLVNIANKLASASYSFTPEGTESAEARRLLAEAQELINDPYDPEVDGLRINLIDAKDLESLPDMTWLVKGEIPDKGLTIVFGPSGVGKSFLVLDYAMWLAQRCTVLYVAAEGEGGFKKRVRAWTLHNRQAPGDLKFYLNVAALLDRAERNAFESQIIEHVKPKLIVIDTFAHCMLPGDENSARDMGLFLRATKEIQKKYDCAMLLVHHTNKEGQIERGSGSMRGAADSMIRLTGEDDLITVECSKTKDEKPFETRYIKLLPVLVGEDENGESQYSPVIIAAEKMEQQPNDPLTNRQRVILETIVDSFEFGASVVDLSETLHLNRGAINKAMPILKRLGFISHEDRGAPFFVTDAGRLAVGRSPIGKNDSNDSNDSSLFPDEIRLSDGDVPNDSNDSMIPIGDQEEDKKRGIIGNKGTTAPASQKTQGNKKEHRESLESSGEKLHICPMCTKPMEHTRKGWQCPDCGAIWEH